MGDIDERDAEALLDVLEFDLHVLAEFEVESAEGLIEEEHFRVDCKRSGDGDALLLSAGQRVDGPALEPLEVHEGQHLLDLRLDSVFLHLFETQTKGDVLIYVQVREQRITLKNGVHAPFVGRDTIHDLIIKNDLAGVRFLETRNNAQCRRFTTARRAEDRNEFPVFDVEVEVVQDRFSVKGHANVFESDDDVFFHLCTSFFNRKLLYLKQHYRPSQRKFPTDVSVCRKSAR